MWLFDHRSTHRNIRPPAQSFPSDRTGGESSRTCAVTNKSKSLTYTVAASFVCTLPVAVTTVLGFLDTRTVSSCAAFRSFLLGMCMGIPVSTTHFPSSGFIEDGAGRHQTSEGGKNVALCLFFELVNASGQFPRISDRYPLSMCASVSVHAPLTFSFPIFFIYIQCDFRTPHTALGSQEFSIPKTLCSSVRSTWISAAVHPGTSNPIVLHS